MVYSTKRPSSSELEDTVYACRSCGAELIRTWQGSLDERQVREEMEGNLCRCTGYHNIVKAIQYAAEKMAGK